MSTTDNSSSFGSPFDGVEPAGAHLDLLAEHQAVEYLAARPGDRAARVLEPALRSNSARPGGPRPRHSWGRSNRGRRPAPLDDLDGPHERVLGSKSSDSMSTRNFFAAIAIAADTSRQDY
jgi:hypothetical protein